MHRGGSGHSGVLLAVDFRSDILMKLDSFLDRHIEHSLAADNMIERGNHKPSGKLSASALGDPLQWQILKSLAAEPREFDSYVLRKFLRGKQVEQWFLSAVPGIIEPPTKEKQEFVQYRDVVGYMDAFVDTSPWDFPVGNAPLEVKSIANAKFKRLLMNGSPDRGHLLQGALYGLAKQTPHFVITYIASDDYRVRTYILNTLDYKEEVDRIIDRYERQKATGKIPVFEPEEKWQANPKYNRYNDWAELTQEEIDARQIAMGLVK